MIFILKILYQLHMKHRVFFKKFFEIFIFYLISLTSIYFSLP